MLYHLPNQRIRRYNLDADYERAGVPVFEITFREYMTEWYEVVREDYSYPSQFMGMYHNDRAIEHFGLPARFILINKSMPNYEKLMVLWHEIGHHSCVKASCLCAKRGFDFRKTELHAELACIYIATRRGNAPMTLELLKEATGDLLNDGGRSLDYIRNATMMVKHEVWDDALGLVGPDFKRWLSCNRHLRQRYEVALADESTRKCRWQPTNYLKRFSRPIE